MARVAEKKVPGNGDEAEKQTRGNGEAEEQAQGKGEAAQNRPGNRGVPEGWPINYGAVQKPDEIEFNVAGKKARKRSQREASIWIFSPGNFQLLKWGERAIAGLGIRGGPPISQVDYLRAARVKGKRRVFLFATDDKDPDAVEVNRADRRVTANFSDDFIDWGYALAINTRSRFRLIPSTPADPIHPAMIIDLDAPLDTKSITKKQTKEEQEKAKLAKAERAKAEEAKREQAKAEEAKREQAKAEEAKREQAKEEPATDSDDPGRQPA